MKTVQEVREWIDGARSRFGDPATPVCQLFVRYVDAGGRMDRRGLWAWREPGRYMLRLGSEPELLFPLGISLEGPMAPPSFIAEFVTRGVWALAPSLNASGKIHAFVVLYDVPHPAPWQR